MTANTLRARIFERSKFNVHFHSPISRENNSINSEFHLSQSPLIRTVRIEENGQIDLSQTTMHHLRWMLQKDLLGQDMFLIGRPGPLRRTIVMQYLQLTQRELEYVALSRDTTESDLKQRREILNGTAKYFDQSAVNAAVHGRVLVIEGIEKAERNVLPVLNNLLENREMHLEDGRFLIPAERYDRLLAVSATGRRYHLFTVNDIVSQFRRTG